MDIDIPATEPTTARVSTGCHAHARSLPTVRPAPRVQLPQGDAFIRKLRGSVARIISDIRSVIDDELSWVNESQREQWRAEVDELKAWEMPCTRIGVCGATGAGKSSLINALLDREVVPVSGVGACTAAVIEIAYHKETMTKAEISFLTREEWEGELAHLLKDVDPEEELDGPEVKIAWEKIQACYPEISPNDLPSMTMEQIMSSSPGVLELLGSVKTIQGRGAGAFAEELGYFVEAPAENSGAMVPWPLVKQARVFCNAPVLSCGAILVDLPGVADANSARNAISQRQMANCDLLWIATQVMRAADDATVSELVDKSFKRQAAMDGLYNSQTLTIILTKTCDLLPDEIIRRLNLKNHPVLTNHATHHARLEEEAAGVKVKLEDLKRQQQSLPSMQRVEPSGKVTKRMRFNDPSSESNCSHSLPMPESQELAMENVYQMRRISKLINSLEQRQEQLIQDIRKSEYEHTTFLANARSESCRVRVQAGFKRDMVLLQASSRRRAKASRKTPVQSLDERDVPVFGVSSREYALLTGLVKANGKGAQIFSQLHDTGIPSLQDYCREVSLKPRERALALYARSISLLVQSMEQFLIDFVEVPKADRSVLCSRWTEGQSNSLTKRGLKLRSSIESKLQQLVDDVNEELCGNLLGTLDEDCTKGADKAKGNALVIHDTIADPSNMSWQRYRAILRKKGIHRVHRTEEIDLNARLIEPALDTIVGSWYDVFNSDMSQEFVSNAGAVLDNIFEEFLSSCPQSIAPYAKNHEQVGKIAAMEAISQAAGIVNAAMQGTQRQISRGIVPHIQNKLRIGYEVASGMHGRGSTSTQKVYFRNYLDRHREFLFHEWSQTMQGQLHTVEAAINRQLNMVISSVTAKVYNGLARHWAQPPNQRQRALAEKVLSTIHAQLDTLTSDDDESDDD